jgi:hypothetical protein
MALSSGLTPLHFCACHKIESKYQSQYDVALFVFDDVRREVAICLQ